MHAAIGCGCRGAILRAFLLFGASVATSAVRRPITLEIPYRPDIDGLRAVAVLSVIAFHAFPKAIAGGFIGVDVFFVISGYLISSLILSGLKNGSFSFLDFYARRARRIFPALTVVLIFVWGAGLLFLFRQILPHSAN